LINQENYLDVWQLFVNVIIGDLWLFVFIGCILITYFCLRKQVGWQPTIMLNLIWLMIVFSEATDALLIVWVFILLFIGSILYFTISKALRRG